MEKIELGIKWADFLTGDLAYNVISKAKITKFLGELAEHGILGENGWNQFGEATTYFMENGTLRMTAHNWVSLPVMMYDGCRTREDAAKSKGFCTRKKGPDDDSKAPYAAERRWALESGVFTSFESQLLGTNGLNTGDIIQIVDSVELGERLFQWGDSQKIIEVGVLSDGSGNASKKVLKISEFGGNGDGFVIKYNYDPDFCQVAAEAKLYDDYAGHPEQKLLAKIYKHNPHLACGKYPVKNIKGNACSIVQDGVIFAEYCDCNKMVKRLNGGNEHLFYRFTFDVKESNMGTTSDGRVVLIDYGV